MRHLPLIVLALVFGLAANCNTPPAPPPPSPPPPIPVAVDSGSPAPVPSVFDAGRHRPKPTPTGDAYDAACAAMVKAGCSDGLKVDCAAVMRHVGTSGLTKVPLACITAAGTVAADRKCGYVRCL